MLKLEFFPQDVIDEYEKQIIDKVKERNSNRDNLIFLSYSIDPANKKDYSISIHELLTQKREQILKIDGIKLYMCICSAQKYKYMSNVGLLHTLYQKFPNLVFEMSYEDGNYEYEINGVRYSKSRKDDISADSIINEAASLIKSEFSNIDANYANKYFDIPNIGSVADLKITLDTMFDDLKGQLISSKSKEPIISYSLISGNLRHRLMASLGVRTCPYCNRNYITRYGVKGSKSTADLDHFYQKEQYPLFALSLFNFVPSCPVCNSRMKNVHPADDTMYPYEEGFGDDVHFELKYTGKDISSEKILHFWQALSKFDYNDIEIEAVIDSGINSERKRRIEKSKELFHIDEVYADHKQDALEIALRTRIYCEGSYEKFCRELFDEFDKKGMRCSSVSDMKQFLFRAGFDYEWLIFGISMNDENRRFDKPLSKMIYDIYNSEKL
mgnify:CR=1 FL=1